MNKRDQHSLQLGVKVKSKIFFLTKKEPTEKMELVAKRGPQTGVHPPLHLVHPPRGSSGSPVLGERHPPQVQREGP